MPEEIEIIEITRHDSDFSVCIPVESRLLSIVWDEYEQVLKLIIAGNDLCLHDDEKKVEFDFIDMRDIQYKCESYTPRTTVKDGFEYMCSISYTTREEGTDMQGHHIVRECHNFLVFVKEEYPEPPPPHPQPQEQSEDRILDI